MAKKRAALLGATGYTGAEFIRLLAPHPDIEMVLLTSQEKAGQSIASLFPSLQAFDLPDLMTLEEVEWPAIDVDVVFSALPHQVSQTVIKALCHTVHHSLLEELVAEGTDDFISRAPDGIRIIDVSADFRLKNPTAYLSLYGQEHEAPELLSRAIYGLPEMAGDAVKEASLIACPGPYATAALLALTPLLDAGLIDIDDMVVDAKIGVSGAGRHLREAFLFSDANETLRTFHQNKESHLLEMEQMLSQRCGKGVSLCFATHLCPMSRGLMMTIFTKPAGHADVYDLTSEWQVRYANSPFVHVAEPDTMLTTQMVRGTNRCVIGASHDARRERLTITAVLDNLIKGSVGQAIQNMNLMFDLDEDAGLEHLPLFP